MTEDKQDGEREPRRLLYRAHRRAAEERERVTAAPYVDDSVIDTQMAEVEYHAAIMEYFSRLKPHLPDRPEFWDDIPLWNEPREGRRKELAAGLAEYYGIPTTAVLDLLESLEENDSWPEIQPQDEDLVRGLKNLVHWRGRTQAVEQTREDVIQGEITETVTKPMHLPREIALRAHDALDSAMADLGYDVRPGKEVAKTSIDDGGEYEVEEVRTDR